MSPASPVLFAALGVEEQAALIARLKSRDPKALEELYDCYGKLIYSLILRIVRDSAAAEDLTQETFLRIWNRAHAFDVERGKFAPWIVAIARNRALGHLRSVERRTNGTILELVPSEQPALFAAVDADVLNESQGRRLKKAFDELNPNQRSVLEMAYFEGFSQKDIAVKRNQPLSEIKEWMDGALSALRAAMAPGNAK